MTKPIDTNLFSTILRERSIDLEKRKLLVSNLRGTEQEKDLTEPANCNGYGRIRHFRRETSDGWPPNPLPIDPASRSLGVPACNLLEAQVFQNASCNWRCWYCYVPFSLLNADQERADWLGPTELVDLYLSEPARPRVMDLSGGQPDLVPEWVPWMMQELRSRQLDQDVYLWSDDNLSNDYFWRYLSAKDRELVASYKNYGKVCCFKGFNSASFAFNTQAEPELFEQQFTLMRRFVELGIDVYGYVTLTTPTGNRIRDDVRRFVDSLQSIHPNLPLRVIPLEISCFTPVINRIKEQHETAMQNQQEAIASWQEALESRFSSAERTRSIIDISLVT